MVEKVVNLGSDCLFPESAEGCSTRLSCNAMCDLGVLAMVLRNLCLRLSFLRTMLGLWRLWRSWVSTEFDEGIGLFAGSLSDSVRLSISICISSKSPYACCFAYSKIASKLFALGSRHKSILAFRSNSADTGSGPTSGTPSNQAKKFRVVM
jgi:hypothetical protein